MTYRQALNERRMESIKRDFQILAAGMTRSKEAALARIDYQDFLRSTYWGMVANYVRLLHGNRCDICHGADGLEVHHRTYDHRGAEYRYLHDLAVLCRRCHRVIHKTKGARANGRSI